MATQPQARHFTPEQLAAIRGRIESQRQAEQEETAARRRGLQQGITGIELNRDRTFGETASDTGLALTQGLTDLGSAAFGIGNVASGGMLEQATGLSDNFAETDRLLEDAKSNQLQYRKAMAGQAFDESLVSGAAAYLTDPGLLTDLLVRSAPSILPGAAVGGRLAQVSGAAGRSTAEVTKAAARGATGATAAQTGGMAYTEAYNQAIEEGLSESEANARAYAAAGIVAPATAASMAIPGLGPAGVEGQVLARMFGGEAGRRAGAGIGVGRAVLDATGRETVQETIQGTSEQFAQNLVSTERNIDDNLGQAAVLSAIAGGAMGLGVGALRAPSELRSNLDQLRTETAEDLGDPDLGMSDIEQNDARVQGAEVPDYLSDRPAFERAAARGRVPAGRDLLGDNLRPDSILEQDETIEAEGVPTDFQQVAAETGQQSLFDEPVPGAQPPLPDVSGDSQSEADLRLYLDTVMPREQDGSLAPLPTVEETTPEVREIETNTDNELEEALQITELFQPRIRDALQAGITTEGEIIRGVQAMRNSGLLPPRAESENTQRLFESVTTPETGITQDDLYSPPLETPEAKAYKAYQRRVAERGRPAEIPEGQDLLGDDLDRTARASELLERREQVRARREGGTPQQVDDRTGDLLATTPNAVRTPREDIGSVIDRVTGVSRDSQVSAADFQTAEDAYIADQFRETGRTDSGGNPIYQQYDRNLQTFVDVSASEAQAEAAEFVRQRTAAPSELFRDAMAQEFELAAGTALRGKGWNSFAEQVDQAGVRPTDQNVASELVAVAEKMASQDLPNSKFLTSFMNKYGPGSEIAESVAPPKQVKKAKKPAKKSEAKTYTGKDWKQTLAKKLGLKPSQMRGKAWAQFDEMVRERNIGPTSEEAEQFLADVSAAIDAPPESAPAFAATLRTAYPVAEQETTVEAAETPAPQATSEATEATAGLSRGEEVVANDLASRENVRLRTEFFVNRFVTMADEVRAESRTDGDARKEISKLLKKMVNEISNPSDIPALARAMYSQLDVRRFTLKQKTDAFYKPLANLAKNFMAEATTAAELNSVFQYVDQVFGEQSGFPDRNAATGTARNTVKPLEALEAELASYYGDRVDILQEDPANQNNTKKFSRTGEGTSSGDQQIGADRFRRAVDRANRLANPGEKQIRAFDTVTEAAEALGISIPKDANGVYYNGEAIVIRENITSDKQLADAILHERAHGGLEGLLGTERLKAVQNRLWSNNSLRRRIQTKMRTYGLTRQDAAEEVVVDMMVSGEEINKSIFSKIRAAIQRTVDALIGASKYTMNDADVTALLRDTADYMRGGRTWANDGPFGGYASKLAELETAIEGRGAVMTPKFSQAGIDLEAATQTGAVNFDGMKKASSALSAAVKDAVNSGSIKPLSELMPSTVQRLPTLTMDFMPLRAMARHYRGQMMTTMVAPDGTESQVDTLQRQADLVRGRDNDFNKTLNETREYTYRGADGGQEAVNTSPLQVADTWAKFRRKQSTKAQALDKLNNRATTYKLHPDRPWEQQSKLNYEKLPYTEAERRQQFDKIRSEWEQAGSEGQQLYRESQAIYNQMWSDRFKEIENAILRESGIERLRPDPETGEMVRNQEWVKKWRTTINSAMAKLSEGPYSPLQRHGDFFVTVRDGSGNVLSFMGFDTEREARIAKRNLIDSKTDDEIKVQFTMRRDFDQAMDGMNRKVYENLENSLNATFEGDAMSQASAKEALQSVYLAGLEDSHILKHGIKRKLTDGASLDTLRGFSSYTMKSARNLSSMRFDHQIEDNLRDMEKAIDPEGSPQKVVTQNKVYDAIRRQHRAAIEYQQNKIVDTVGQFGFVYWMTSPAQMALNASQTALVTIPRLAARYNMSGAARAVRDATAKFAGSKFKGMHDPDNSPLDKNSPHYQVMRELYGRGVLDFTLSHDMSGLSRGDSFGMNNGKRTALRWASTFMHTSEVANREIAAYAAVQMEMENNPELAAKLTSENEASRAEALSQLTDTAEYFVDTTQFDYSGSNKPTRLQGPLGRLVFQFQQFRINMLAMMASDIKEAFSNDTSPEGKAAKREARRALIYMTGMQLMMTGAAGSVLAPVAFAILDGFRDDDELLSAREEFIQTMPQWMSQGILSFGMDTARFGFDTLLPFGGADRYMPVSDRTDEQFHWLLTSSLGAWVGLGDNMMRGWDSLMGGDPLDAFGKFAPRLVADPVTGLLEMNQPTMTRDDIPYYTPSPYDRIMNAMGLKTGSQAEAQHDRTAVYNGSQRAKIRKQSLLTQYHLASTPQEQREVLDAHAQWNRTNPENPITNASRKASAMSRQNKMRNAQELGVPLSSGDTDLARRLIEGQ